MAHLPTEPSTFEPQTRLSEIPSSREVTGAAGPLHLSYFHASDGALDRVGGMPSWVQGPRAVPCAKCGGLMSFVAQFGDPTGELWSGDSGALYAFHCRSDQVVATLAQCT